MQLEQLPTGLDVPNDIFVLVEIPANGPGLKLELDKASGAMLVDRFLTAPMFYPCNYGFIPHTLSEDGDPLDALVVSPIPLISGVVVRCRPVAIMLTEDESGMDPKILCVPVSSVTPLYDNVKDLPDLSPLLKEQLSHFFTHYKDLEPGKWMRVLGWRDAASAKAEILESVARFAACQPTPNF